MKKFVAVPMIAFVLLGSVNAHSQRTPEDLAIITFYCFQENNLDSFYKLIPTVDEIRDFGASAGVDTNSANYKALLTRYPSVVDQFKQKCFSIENNAAIMKFSWANSTLDSISISEKNVPVDNSNADGKTLAITILDIHFTSNNQSLMLTLGDVKKYNGIWKPGNRIALSKP